MPRSEFFKKMKKKPALQAILDDLDNYSVEDLEKVDQPLWIREELQNLKTGPVHEMNAEALADQMTHGAEWSEPESFPVFRHAAPSTFYDTVHNGQFSFEIQIDENDTFLLVSSNGGEVRIGDQMQHLTVDALNKLEHNCEFVDMMTVDAYKAWYREKLNTRHGNDMGQVLSDALQDPDDRGWFRIQRH